MLKMYLEIFILLASVQCAVFQTYDKVNLTYIYQARCPYCSQYVEQQLYRGYQHLSNYINIELFPIVSSIGPRGQVSCSHGENECFISKAHACAFERPGVTDAMKVEYLRCTLEKAKQSDDVTDADIKACVELTLKDVVSYNTVRTCMNGDESSSLLQGYSDRADRYGVNFVPWLAFFGNYDGGDYRRLKSNLVHTICQKLNNPPVNCNHLPSSSKKVSII